MDYLTFRVPPRALVRSFGLFFLAFAALPGAAPFAADTVTAAAPGDDTLLEIRGAVDAVGATARFDRARLAKFLQIDITTDTPWHDGDVTFSGPLLRDLLDAVGARGQRLDATALNDYRVSIPIDDARHYPVIVATRLNGKPLRIRDRGPLWIIYPWRDYDELRNETYYSRAIWQLEQLVVD